MAQVIAQVMAYLQVQVRSGPWKGIGFQAWALLMVGLTY